MASGQAILMPKLGLTMTEGVLAEWLVAPGDRVQAGQIIFVVETDKISNEIEAAEAGVIEALHAATGDLVPVGHVVASFASDAGEYSAPLTEATAAVAADEPPSQPQVPSIPTGTAPRIVATPLARRLAAAAGIDLADLTGSGVRGRILAEDVAAASSASGAAAESPSLPAAGEPGGLRPLGQYQKVAALRLTEAKREIPHFYVFAEADVTQLIDVRAGLNADPGHAKLTISHFLIAATARALGERPEVNCVWQDEAILDLPDVSIGLAVEGPKGLVAPVVKSLGGKGLEDIASLTQAVVERARMGRLSPDELTGGATSISNVGMFGATGLLPIINPGQSSILGVGRSQPRYMPGALGRPELRQMLSLSLSCDHRVIDGAAAARFLQSVQCWLETPLALLRPFKQGSRP